MKKYLQRNWWKVLQGKQKKPNEFLHMCKTNPNLPQNIPDDLNNKFMENALEIGFFSQVVLIQRKVTEE